MHFLLFRMNNLDTHRVWTTLTYESLVASSPDRSLNLITGFFTAPIDGTYFFHAHASSWDQNIDISIRKNFHPMSYAYDHTDHYVGTISTSLVLELSRNDVIDVTLLSHLVDGSIDGRTEFSGYLLE